MDLQESLRKRLVGLLRTEVELSKPGLTSLAWPHETRVLLGTRATQPTLPAGPTSTTTVLYVDSVPQREKELASTSFGHMRAFNSLSRALSASVRTYGVKNTSYE